MLLLLLLSSKASLSWLQIGVRFACLRAKCYAMRLASKLATTTTTTMQEQSLIVVILLSNPTIQRSNNPTIQQSKKQLTITTTTTTKTTNTVQLSALIIMRPGKKDFFQVFSIQIPNSISKSNLNPKLRVFSSSSHLCANV